MEPTIFHEYMAIKIRDKIPLFKGSKIDRRIITKILCRSHIPTKIHHQFIKELEEMGFVKLINRKTIEILEDKIDLISIEPGEEII